MKGNQPELMEAVRHWLEGNGVDARAADVREVSKGHGRLEERELWLVESEALGAYLEHEHGWPGLRWCGLIRRRRRKLTQETWQEEEVLWVAGGNLPCLTARQALEGLRGHWEIENKLFWVRDVTMDEDRLSGRAIGLGLSEVRNAVIQILRHLGYRYIPDGWRAMAARPDRGMSLLTHGLR